MGMKIMERVSGFVRVAVTAVQCGSWQFAKELEEQHRLLMVNSEGLGRRRQEDEGE